MRAIDQIFSAAFRSSFHPQPISVVKLSNMDGTESQPATKTSPGKLKTSIHVTAIDGIVNVNSLFTVAVFIGFSIGDPAASSTGHPLPCEASSEIVQRLILYEVISFSCFLSSSLIAQTLKLIINLLNNLDPIDYQKADINPRVLKTFLLGAASGSLMGSVFLMLSIANIVQVKLGVLPCGGKTVWAIVILGSSVGSALLGYFMASIYALWFIYNVTRMLHLAIYTVGYYYDECKCSA